MCCRLCAARCARQSRVSRPCRAARATSTAGATAAGSAAAPNLSELSPRSCAIRAGRRWRAGRPNTRRRRLCIGCITPSWSPSRSIRRRCPRTRVAPTTAPAEAAARMHCLHVCRAWWRPMAREAMASAAQSERVANGRAASVSRMPVPKARSGARRQWWSSALRAPCRSCTTTAASRRPCRATACALCPSPSPSSDPTRSPRSSCLSSSSRAARSAASSIPRHVTRSPPTCAAPCPPST